MFIYYYEKKPGVYLQELFRCIYLESEKCTGGRGRGGLLKLSRSVNCEPGARFTKHLKPKIFVSSIQIVWNLRKS